MKRKHKDQIPEALQPLPMLESRFPADWNKGIRSEINRYKELHSRSGNKKYSNRPAMLDLERAMEKRRIQALQHSIEELPPERKKYVTDWVTTNIITSNYSHINDEYHLMTAAAIWILDHIKVSDKYELYKLLPRDERLIEELCIFDICDTEYSDSLIASVEYALRNRNADIAPLEDDGTDGKRVFTSNLAAEGKCHGDVPSRNNFEALLHLIPQHDIDEAVRQFERCYEAYKDHFFLLTSYVVDDFEDKRERINQLRTQINQERERAIAAMRKTYDTYKQRYTQKSSPTAVMNPLMMNKLPDMSLSNPSTLTPLASMLNRSPDDLEAEYRPIFARLEQLDEKHDKLLKEFDAVLELRGATSYRIGTNGYIDEMEYAEHYSAVSTEILDPLPFTDPYAMCFALLYLIEQDSDIPWLYGSCLAMMHEVADSLPWAHYEYDETEDEYWVDFTDEGEYHQLALPGMDELKRKKQIFPDWYQRDYRWKDENRFDARNLAQILYEETGCLMPRNLHRYDDMLKGLGKYGLRQNKAVSMLYCMIALGTKRRHYEALNLEPSYMSIYDKRKDSASDGELSREELNSQLTKLQQEVRQLRAALHSAEKSASDTKKKLAEQKAAAESEHRELADLREIVFKTTSEDIAEDTEEASINFPYTVQRTTVVFGGHDTWVKVIKPLLKGDIKFIPREMKIDVSLIRYADVIWIQTNALPHRSYYSIVDTARKYHKPIRYFTFASASKCAEQLAEND